MRTVVNVAEMARKRTHARTCNKQRANNLTYLTRLSLRRASFMTSMYFVKLQIRVAPYSNDAPRATAIRRRLHRRVYREKFRRAIPADFDDALIQSTHTISVARFIVRGATKKKTARKKNQHDLMRIVCKQKYICARLVVSN